MTVFTAILAFIVAVGLLVTVHELGHYSVARLFNVRILRFSIGFGPALWLRRFGPDRTEWVVAAIPLGGYVRMLDAQDEEATPDQLPRTFSRQSVGKRIAIVLAGPMANFLLAGVVYWALFVNGMPGLRPFLGAPQLGTAAAVAGVQERDLVTQVNGEAVTTWQDLRWMLLQRAVERGDVALTITDQAGVQRIRTVSLGEVTKEDIDRDFLSKVGLSAWRPRIEPVASFVQPGLPAAGAGLVAGDRVLTVDGVEVRRWEDMAKLIGARAGEVVRLKIQRGDTTLEVSLVPQAQKDGAGKPVGRIGISPPPLPEDYFITVRAGPVEAVGKSVVKLWDMSVFSLSMLGKMITGDLSWKNLSGPISIADYAGQSVRQGMLTYLTFLALISISIGVLNLLPIPVLDGGQLVYYLIELFKGSPVSQRVIEAGQQVGVFVLLGLTAFAIYNDIHRLIAG
ncbi:MAG: RIP metalloprotease RseP [Betaproteobacteria bacterium]|nr:RIP metalloprotease RseP [Betaproteobacteria bacterium]